MTSANTYHCPLCGREGSSYVVGNKDAQGVYDRYVCPKHHTWRVTVSEVKRKPLSDV